MAKTMSSVDLMFMVEEMQSIVGAKIDKVFEYESTQFYIQCHHKDKGKFFIKIHLPGLIFLTKNRTEAEIVPSELCMQLRKHLIGTCIREISQVASERILKITLKGDENSQLFIELFSPGNILVVQDTLVKVASKYHKWSERTIRPNIEYVHPKKDVNYKKISGMEFTALIEDSNGAVSRILAVQLGLGKTYAEEVCAIAGIDKKKEEVNKKEAELLYSALKNLLAHDLKPCLVFEDDKIIDAAPYPLEVYKGKNSQETSTFSAAVEKTPHTNSSGQTAPHDAEIRKIKAILNEQEKMIQQLTAAEQENKDAGELIYLKYGELTKLIEFAKEARAKHLDKELKENGIELHNNSIIINV